MAEIGIMKKLTIGGSTYTIPEYNLPIASASTLGGVKIGTGLSINSTTGVLSATGLDYDEADPVFTASAAYGITSSDISNWNNMIPANVNGNTQKLYRPLQLNGLSDNTLDAKINTLRANRLAFLPADQIIIEKTTDGGSTWTDAGVSDATKVGLFSETRAGVNIPLLNGVKNTNCGLRITITGMKYNVPANTAETSKYNYWNSDYVVSTERYNQLKEMYFWVGSNTDTISVKVERATGAASTTWYTIFDNSNYGMTGWSGNDYIRFTQGVFGGGTTQTGNYWNYRLTFFTRGPGGSTTLSGSYTTSSQSIMEIRAYGDTWWTAGNKFASDDHLYSWDYLQNATFPAKVTANGGFSGNVTGNVSGTAANVTGTVAIANGGTGQTTAANAINTLLNGLPVWTADPTDTTYFVRQDTGGSASYGKVAFSTIWNYISGKLPSWSKASTKPSYNFSEIGSKPITLSGYGITDTYTKTEVNGLISGVLHYKGTKASVANLPTTGNITGDVWHITADGSEYAYDGENWQELGTAVDLSGYALKSEIPTISYPVTSVNNKTGAVSLTYSDVSAAASSHTHGNITNGGDITATAPTIANGDQLIINDHSASKITNGPTFDGSTTTTALTPKGTWETFSKFSGSYNDLTNKPTIPTVPTNISAFTNDSGYITSADVPEGASAYTGTISAVTSGNASAGSNNGFARGDHTHNITKATINTVLGTGSGTAKFYREDGTWATPAYTTNTDTKLQVAAVTSGTTYYPIVGTGTTAATRQYDTTGFVYVGTNGTANGSNGNALLTLGNSTASSTANWKKGTVRLYGTTAYYTDLVSGAPSANRTITFPNVTGTVALTSDIPSVPTTATNSTTGITASTTANKTTVGSSSTDYGVTAAGSGSFTSGTFSGGSGSFAATVTSHVLSFSHTHTAATHGADSHTHTAPTLGSKVPTVSTASATVSITDPGHTHTLS